MSKFLVACSVALCLLPPCATAQSVATMSRSVYEAQFRTWPVMRTGQGYVGGEGKAYAMEATGNAWMGTGKALPIAPLSGDFVLDIAFTVVFKEDCSVNITVSDAGRDYSQLDFFFDMWQTGPPSISIYENAVQSDFYVNIKRRFADREQVRISPSLLEGNKRHMLSIRRERNTVSFLLDGSVLKSFPAPHFTVRKFGIGIAFKSKILLTSVRARTPQ
jgi:hypothetical protein